MSGVNKWGLSDDSSSSVSEEDLATKVSKSGDTMRGDLDMGGHFIRNLHPPMANTDGATKLYVDAISSRSVDKTGDNMTGDLNMGHNYIKNLHDPNTAYDAANKNYVDNTLLDFVGITGGTMNGDLLLSGGSDTYRNLGCTGLNVGKTFQVLLGDNNFFSYTKPPVGIVNPVILNCNGFLIKFRDNNIMRIATSGSDMEIITYTRLKLNAEINCNGHNIYNLADPLTDSDAATKRYIDKRKNLIGYVPFLTANDSKLGFIVSTSSLHSVAYTPSNVFNHRDTAEWATSDVNNFWIKVQCPEAVVVWRFALRGRLTESGRIYNWRFEGSNDDINWTTLHSESNYKIENSLYYFDTPSNSTPYSYYRIYVVNAEQDNPGLRRWQIYTYHK